MLPISQLTVLVAPTAAVACVPIAPTIAVSIYCTAVCISSSSIVGHASVRMVGTIPHGRKERFDFSMISSHLFFCIIQQISPNVNSARYFPHEAKA